MDPFSFKELGNLILIISIQLLFFGGPWFLWVTSLSLARWGCWTAAAAEWTWGGGAGVWNSSLLLPVLWAKEWSWSWFLVFLHLTVVAEHCQCHRHWHSWVCCASLLGEDSSLQERWIALHWEWLLLWFFSEQQKWALLVSWAILGVCSWFWSLKVFLTHLIGANKGSGEPWP